MTDKGHGRCCRAYSMTKGCTVDKELERGFEEEAAACTERGALSDAGTCAGAGSGAQTAGADAEGVRVRTRGARAIGFNGASGVPTSLPLAARPRRPTPPPALLALLDVAACTPRRRSFPQRCESALQARDLYGGRDKDLGSPRDRLAVRTRRALTVWEGEGSRGDKGRFPSFESRTEMDCTDIESASLHDPFYLLDLDRPAFPPRGRGYSPSIEEECGRCDSFDVGIVLGSCEGLPRSETATQGHPPFHRPQIPDDESQIAPEERSVLCALHWMPALPEVRGNACVWAESDGVNRVEGSPDSGCTCLASTVGAA